MNDMTPRCPHCSNLTLVGTVAGRLVAVCTYCDNGFAVAARSHQHLLGMPRQQVTRYQLEQATEKALTHLTGAASGKQDALIAAESRLPEDRTTWTEVQQQQALSYQSQRMMYAGVLQGATSYRDLLAKALGLPVTTLTSAPVPPAPITSPAPSVPDGAVQAAEAAPAEPPIPDTNNGA